MKNLLSIVLWILLVGGTAFAAQLWVRDANPFHVFQAIKVTSNWALSWDCFFQAQNWVVSDCQGNSFLTGAVGDFLPLYGNTITTPMSWDIYIDNNRALYWWDIYTFIQAEDITPEMNIVAWQWFGSYLKWWINLLHNQVNLFIKQWANILYGVSLWNTWALTYNDDYSTYFVDRSLIDKWYADDTYLTGFTETDPIRSTTSGDYIPKTLTNDITVTWNMHSLSFNTMLNYSINTIWFYLNNLAGGNVLSRWASWLRNYVQSYYYSWIIVDTENLVLKRNIYSVFSDTHIPAIATGYSANDRRQGMSGNDMVFDQYDWFDWKTILKIWDTSTTITNWSWVFTLNKLWRLSFSSTWSSSNVYLYTDNVLINWFTDSDGSWWTIGVNSYWASMYDWPWTTIVRIVTYNPTYFSWLFLSSPLSPIYLWYATALLSWNTFPTLTTEKVYIWATHNINIDSPATNISWWSLSFGSWTNTPFRFAYSWGLMEWQYFTWWVRVSAVTYTLP